MQIEVAGSRYRPDSRAWGSRGPWASPPGERLAAAVSMIALLALILVGSGLLRAAGSPRPASTRGPLSPAHTGSVYAARSLQGGSVEFSNPAQRLRATMSGAGLAVRGAHGLRLDLAAVRVGRSQYSRPLRPGAPIAHGSRVALRADGISEWVANRPAGLEQGFALADRPSGSGPLRISQRVSGDLLSAVTAHGGGGVVFREPTGALAYAGLVVTDARGRRIPAQLGFSAHTLTITIDDARAVYPLRVDPTLSWPTAVELTLPSEANNPNADLLSVACPEQGSCVAGGIYLGDTGYDPMVVSQSGGSWAAATEVALPSNAVDGGGQNSSIGGVACTSPGNCVGVGDYDVAVTYDYVPMVATETNGSWGTAVALETPSNPSEDNQVAHLNGVACTSPGNCVAVGSYFDTSDDGQAMIVAEAGGTWHQGVEVSLPTGAAPDPNAALRAVSCTGAGDCVAVGTYSNGSGEQEAMVVTESGGNWGQAAAVTPPSNADGAPFAQLTGVSCPGQGDCVAVGSYLSEVASNQKNAVMEATETSGTWGQAKEITPPSDDNTGSYSMSLDAVSCPSQGNCVATGDYYNSADQFQAMYATETSSTWASALTFAHLPSNALTTLLDNTAQDAALDSVVCSSSSDCTAVGTYVDNNAKTQAMAVATGPFTTPNPKFVSFSAASSFNKAKLTWEINPESDTLASYAVSCSSKSGGAHASGNLSSTEMPADDSTHPLTVTLAGLSAGVVYSCVLSVTDSSAVKFTDTAKTVATGNVKLPSRVETAGSQVSVAVTCGGTGGCQGSGRDVSGSTGALEDRAIAQTASASTVVLGSFKFKLKAGKRATITFKLTAAGRKLLLKDHTLSTTLILTDEVAGKKLTTDNLLKVVYKKPKAT